MDRRTVGCYGLRIRSISEAGRALSVIAEILAASPTSIPYSRCPLKGWSTNTLKDTIEGYWLKIRGSLFFHAEHRTHSENTAPNNLSDWRGTAWEIHPIIGIEVVPKP